MCDQDHSAALKMPKFDSVSVRFNLAFLEGVKEGLRPVSYDRKQKGLESLSRQALTKMLTGATVEVGRDKYTPRCVGFFEDLDLASQKEYLKHYNIYSTLPLKQDCRVDPPSPSSKRRRYTKKTAPPGGDSSVTEALVPGSHVLIPAKVQSEKSRLGRELASSEAGQRTAALHDFSLYSVDLGTAEKPEKLYGLFSEQPVLHFVCGRENGKCIYSSQPLENSPTATWVLQNSKSMAEAYSRLQLLASTNCMPFVACHAGQAKLGSIDLGTKHIQGKDVDSFDGISWISRSYALYLEMINFDKASKGDTFYAFQFRGFVYLTESNENALVKGVFVVDDNMVPDGMDIVFSNSCVKVRAEGEPIEGVEYGFDILRSSQSGWGEAKLNASLLALLHVRLECMRHHMGPDSEEAIQRKRTELQGFIDKCKETTRERLPEKAYGLRAHAATKSRPSAQVDDHENSQDTFDWSSERTPHQKFKMKYVGIEADEDHELEKSAHSSLREERVEVNSHSIWHGTRWALNEGGSRLTSLVAKLQKKPYVHLPGAGGHTVLATTSSSEHLKAQDCYVMRNGKLLQGRFAVWRFPCMGPEDIAVYNAVLPPSHEKTPIADNAISFSKFGLGCSQLAGGDYDGDLCWLCFEEWLVDFVQFTELGVQDLPIELAKLEVGKNLKESSGARYTATDGKGISNEYIRYACKLQTPSLRSDSTVLAERCALLFLQGTQLSWGDRNKVFMQYLICVFTAHSAMDAPKKIDTQSVVDYLKVLRSSSGVNNLCCRSSDFFADELRVEFPGLQKSSVFDCVPALQESTGLVAELPLGGVWCPLESVFLGKEAGLDMGRMLSGDHTGHALNCGELYTRRDKTRTPLLELAHLFAHRLKRKVQEYCCKSLFGLFQKFCLTDIAAMLDRSEARAMQQLSTLYQAWLL